MKNNEAASVLLIAFSIIFFYAVLQADIPGVQKFAVEVGLLALCGMGLQKLLKLEGMYGGLIFRTKKFIDIMDGLSRWNPGLWNWLADLGIVMGFGLSSKLLHKISLRTYVFGLLLLLVSTQMMGDVFNVISSVISLPMDVESLPAAGSDAFTLVQFFVLFSTLFFGLGGMALSGVLISGISILSTLVSYLLNPGSVVLTKTLPGAGPALPGITMPLFEGIIALAVLLAVHETAHGILSRIAKVKIGSCGLLLFGFIPVGAFVDPDEKELFKKPKEAQIRMFGAGSASNLMVFMLLFFVLIAFGTVFYPYMNTNIIVSGIVANSSASVANMTAGTEIYSINGIPVDVNNYDAVKAAAISANSSLEFGTSKGNFKLEPIDGLTGLRFKMPTYGPPALQFIWNTLGLIFVLNLLIGIINLLPIPGFDGFRIVEINTGEKRKWLLKYLAALVVVAFLMNLLPWLWT